jgi:hypothetical protein
MRVGEVVRDQSGAMRAVVVVDTAPLVGEAKGESGDKGYRYFTLA